MIYASLRPFLDDLKKEGQLAIIEAPVDPVLELAEIHRRVIAEQGPALLFTNVVGSAFPVVTNLFGTSRRVDMAFGPRPEMLTRRFVGALDSLLPPTLSALWREKDMLLGLPGSGCAKCRPNRPLCCKPSERTSRSQDCPR